MSYSVAYDQEAIEDLRKLQIQLKKRIVNKIEWLADNFHQITPIALKANLVGLYKLRIGDYRVIYEIDEEEKILVVLKIGHRRDIYG